MGHTPTEERTNWVRLLEVQKPISQKAATYVTNLRRLGVTGAIVMELSLIGMSGAKLLPPSSAGREAKTFGDGTVRTRQVIVRGEPDQAAMEELLKPVFTMLWRAGGQPGIPV